jgi:Cysteine-rich secretory protein family
MGLRSLYFCQCVKLGVLAGLALTSMLAFASEDPVEVVILQPQPAPRGEKLLHDAILRTHNADRSVLKLQPLVWDEALAKDAGIWARDLARRNVFEHAPKIKDVPPQGENLWMGTRDSYTVEEMTGMWREEAKLARSGVFPNVSQTDSWQDVGHYTQMIWPETKAVGCAIASNAEDEFLVCRYFPAGNRIGVKIRAALDK